jgi:hypothetical protein
VLASALAASPASGRLWRAWRSGGTGGAYVRAGRRVGGSFRRPARDGRRGSASGLDTTEVRKCAKAQGIEVKDRQQAPLNWVVNFKATTGQQRQHDPRQRNGTSFI